MCNFNGNLVAWIDGELPPQDAAAVARHVQSCAECRERIAQYRQVSGDFAGFYAGPANLPAPALLKPSRRTPRWVPAAIAIAAAVVVAILLAPRAPKPLPEVQPQTASVQPPHEEPLPVAQSAAPVDRVKRVHSVVRRQPAVQQVAQGNDAEAPPSGPTVRIAIPADSIYPPGAVPEGMAYFANVSLGSDGSVRSVRLER